jgi:hypothetical protein
MEERRMRKDFWKKIAAVALMAAMVMTLVAGCGKGGKDDGGSGDGGSGKNADAANYDGTFTWWIYQIDGEGQYYQVYEDNPVAQYISQQYWDVENGGIGTGETGRKLDFSFIVPVGGSESENFNTMIGTEEYPEIIDMSVATDNPQTMYENGILMDITQYVEDYMPNYRAFLDKNPELKPFVQSQDEDGNIHYYAIYNLRDGVIDPWAGYSYRRDWVVKYAKPTEYVWDWDDEDVQKNGHPEVTPLARALEEDNLNGWKKNDVTKFEADYGADPDNDYTDNVIFPSGKTDPYTISDWEWMFEAFAKALEIRGVQDNSSAYCTTVSYSGAMMTGDLVSSFGGGTGSYYIKDRKVSYDGASENFKAYVECVGNWYEKGWLDKQFNTRANDVFFMINSAGVNQGIVGLWNGLVASLGTGIRTSCQFEEDQKDAYTMACPLPINDTYGTEEQMYKEPDALYQDSRKGTATGITTKAEGKDLAALFTFLDWTYTPEGGATMYFGMTKDQYSSVTLDPDLYKEYGYDHAYEIDTDDEGKKVWRSAKDPADLVVLNGIRMAVGLHPANNSEESVDMLGSKVVQHAYKVWAQYLNTGSVLDYTGLLTPEETDAYNKVSTQVNDYVAQNLPKVIKEGMGNWDGYVEGLEKLDPDSVTEYLQKYVDMANK